MHPAKEGTEDMDEAEAPALASDAPEALSAPDAPSAPPPRTTPNAGTGDTAKVAPDAPEARGKMPRSIGAFMWAVILASFGMSATTWIALAVLAGFTEHATLAVPFRGDVLHIPLHLSWLMPIVVDGYVVVALLTWMAPVPPDVAKFAQQNTYGAAGLGTVTQSAFHAWLGWQLSGGKVIAALLAAVIGTLAPAAAAGVIHLRTIVLRRAVSVHATHATHTTLVPQVVALPAALALPSGTARVAPAAALPPAPKAPVPPRVPRARKVQAPPALDAPDELAPRREADDALLSRLHDAWQGVVPSVEGGTREWVRTELKIGNLRAAALIKRYREEFAAGTGTAEVAQ